MKIIVTEPIHDIPLKKLKNHAETICWENITDNDWKQADAIIVRAKPINKEKIILASNLKVIGKHGVGVNSIDIHAAKEKGIQVVYTPTANINSVAELILGMMFCASRKLLMNMEMIKHGANSISPPILTGLELSNKTLGLIGFGRISQRLAEITKQGLNMDIHVYDPFIDDSICEKLGVTKHEQLNELLSLSDFISISVPLLESTKNLISTTEFNHIKPSTILINTSRGGVVNENALYQALINNKLFGAAADVFTKEPPQFSNPLFELPNFIGSLHVGACTEEALLRVGNIVVDDVLAVLQGKQPRYPYII